MLQLYIRCEELTWNEERGDSLSRYELSGLIITVGCLFRSKLTCRTMRDGL